MNFNRFLNLPLLLLITSFFCSCKPQQVANTSTSYSENTIDSLSSTAEKKDDPSVVINSEGINDETSNPIVSLKSFATQRDVESVLSKSSVFSSHFTGFSLYDISRNKSVVNYNADKHFTPASNVKILTLYAALKTFGNKLPGVLYRETTDTLFLRPIGDPTLLHQFFSNQPIIKKIKRSRKPVTIEWPNDDPSVFGIGWMWDDYSYAEQPELSWMPIYGNVVHFEYNKSTISTTPDLFKDLIEVTQVTGKSNTINRDVNYNYFYAEIRFRNWAFEKDVPFKYSKALFVKLLGDVVNIPVNIVPERKLRMDTLYSQPIDTVLRRMMQESDNFLAEQLLIMAAWRNGFDNTEDFREYVVANWLSGIEPVWIDGSGMSRYNLIRPIDNVRLLNMLYKEFGWSRIHSLLAEGGRSGTIKDWYPNEADPRYPSLPTEPYIIAKTGTLSNNHSLSGFLQTRSGKLLIFSFMNNNYVRPKNEVKEAMQQLLEDIRDS
ncbi:MAG: hypothetical protein GY816_10970, partial [Cytophagales bacterium]|nr:hypothetical protein [Cytophagales bacterium]